MTESVGDGDVAYRLIHPSLWLLEEGRPMSSLFRDREASVFIASRLPAGPDQTLHVGAFTAFGRLALPVGELRRLVDTAGNSLALDVVLDPGGALPPFESLRGAHAVLIGGHTARASRVLLEAVVAHPQWIERTPSLPGT